MDNRETMNRLISFGAEIDSDSLNGTFRGRKIRITCNGDVDIGDGDFDRWANSTASSFQPDKKINKFERQLERAFDKALTMKDE